MAPHPNNPDDQDQQIIFVEHIDSTHLGDCDAIANEIWSRYTQISSTTPPIETAPRSNRKAKKKAAAPTKDATRILQHWISSFPKPYTTSHEQKSIATVLGLSHTQVTTFCNNYRKRFAKIGKVSQSYSQSSTVCGV